MQNGCRTQQGGGIEAITVPFEQQGWIKNTDPRHGGSGRRGSAYAGVGKLAIEKHMLWRKAG